MEDKNYCVYLHRRTDNDDIIYVGEGRESRAKLVTSSGKRNKAYAEILSKTPLYCEIYRDNLTKKEAQVLEEYLIQKLLDQNIILTNKRKKASEAIPLTGEQFNEILIVDETSPSGLRWKISRLCPLNGRSLIVAYKGDVAGSRCDNGYWVCQGRLAHRIVYAIVHGECPKSLTVDHIDGNHENNSISNLQILTLAANSRKSHNLRTYNTIDGVKHGLSESDVLQMYKMFENLYSDAEIAKQFNVKDCTVRSVRKGESWRNLYLLQTTPFPESPFSKVYSAKQIETVLHLLTLTRDIKFISEITKVKTGMIYAIRARRTCKTMIDNILTKSQNICYNS